MPGVLVLETMAQIGGFVFYDESKRDDAMVRAVLAGFDRVRFRRPVLPGDTLRVEAELEASVNRLARVRARAYCGSTEVASADITYKFLA